LAVTAAASSEIFQLPQRNINLSSEAGCFVYPSHIIFTARTSSGELASIRQYDRRFSQSIQAQIESASKDFSNKLGLTDLTLKVSVQAGGGLSLTDFLKQHSDRELEFSDLGNNMFFYWNNVEAVNLPWSTGSNPHLKFLKLLNERKTQANVLLEFSGNELSAWACSKDGLVFYNRFDIAGSKDVLYFTLLIFKQLGLDVETVPLQVGGAVSEDSEVMKLFRKYIQKVQLFNGSTFFDNWPFPRHSMLKHYYPSLIASLI
jgi:hypothetical protein